VLTLRRKEQERLDAERREREAAQAKAEADAQAARQNAQEAQAQAADEARRRAEAETAQAEARERQAAALAAQQQAQAEADAALAAQQQAQAQAEAARRNAEDAQRQKEQAERQTAEAIQQKEELRNRLLAQLNQVLQTKDSARGLIVSMPDVLFDFNKYTLKPEARERLARISGIVLAYPDLHLQVEGHTDSIGSDEYNQELSEKRAATVRDYLVSSGVSINNVVAEGFGKADPVADNGTAAGRKLNRRVDLVVSGEAIGQQIGK
jgi:outer membrane protein OmpA-like peptidoglycan-associated protein